MATTNRKGQKTQCIVEVNINETIDAKEVCENLYGRSFDEREELDGLVKSLGCGLTYKVYTLAEYINQINEGYISPADREAYITMVWINL